MKVVGYNPPKESRFLKFIKRIREECKKKKILYEATRERKVECPHCHAIISYKAHETESHMLRHYINCPSYWCDVLINPCPSCDYYGYIQVTKQYELCDKHPLCWYSNMAKKILSRRV